MKGANQGPLRSVDMVVPLNKLVCFAGPAGSGHRTLAVDVLWAESRRRYMMALSPLEREKLGGVAKIAVEGITGLPPALLVNGNRFKSKPSVASFLRLDELLTRILLTYGELFCPLCNGACLNFSTEAAADWTIDRCFGQRCLVNAPLEPGSEVPVEEVLQELRRAGFRRLWIDRKEHILEEGELDRLPLNSSVAVVVDRIVPKEQSRHRLLEAFNNARAISRGKTWLRNLDTEEDHYLNRDPTCAKCGCTFAPTTTEDLLRNAGKETDQVRIQLAGKSLAEIENLSCAELKEFLRQFSDAEGVVQQADRILEEACAVGLATLKTNVRFPQLSRTQRLRLEIAALGSERMSGLLYVMENPVDGMTDVAAAHLIERLRILIGRGNSIIVVSNAVPILDASDVVFQFALGESYEGPIPVELAHTRTGVVVGKSKLLFSSRDNTLFEFFELELPSHCFIAVCGPEGSGKSYLLREILAPAIAGGLQAGAIAVGDETGKRRVVFASSAIGSSASTLIDAVDLSGHLADLFAASPVSVENGYPAEWFQLTSPGGRCSYCEGKGVLSCDLGILEEVSTVCPHCEGRCFKNEVLEATLKGAYISELLCSSVDHCREKFQRDRKLKSQLDALILSGLGQCRLGHSCAELELGQLILLQLAAALPKTHRRDFVIIADPTGLDHAQDLTRLIRVGDEFIKKGATVVVETNDPRLISQADWMVELAAPTGSGATTIKSSGPVTKKCDP